MIAASALLRARRAGLAMLALAALASSGIVHGADRLLLAGGEVADAAYYSYLGTVLPLGERREGRGWMQRYWLDAFGYEYDGAPGRVQADAYGLEAALGYGGSNQRGWWGAWLGLRYTDTDLDPDDPGASARGSQLGGKLQLEAEGKLAEGWRLGGLASWSNEQNGYWARARLMHAATPVHSFGVEAVASGNDEADATAAGFVAAFQPAQSRWSMTFKAGYRFQDEDDGPYGGVELGYRF